MGMRDAIKNVVQVLWNDEELLRLLYYFPEDLLTGTPDPLSPSLPNILEMDIKKLWEIRDDRIFFTPKTDDLEDKPKCRLFIYCGRRRPQNNYHIADQELIIDILCHFSYEKDMRSMWISDRINKLLVFERIAGIGKIDYVGGNPITAPNEYVGYRHIYEFGSKKK